MEKKRKVGRPKKEQPKTPVKRGRPTLRDTIVREIAVKDGDELLPPSWKGRRYLFKTPQQLERRINEYMRVAPTKIVRVGGVEETRRVYTKHGLMLAVGLDKETFEEYSKIDGFKQVISRAMLVVADCYEQLLHTDKSAGAQFALKNMGWTDGKKNELTVSVNPFIQIMQKRAAIKESVEEAQIVEIDEDDGEE